MSEENTLLTDFELQQELTEYTKEWKNEELFALYAECMTLISSAKSRIHALASQGHFARILGFAGAKNRKLEINIYEKTNQTLRILFQIIKILITRIDIESSRVAGLEELVFEENIKIYDRLEEQKNNLLALEKRVNISEIRLDLQEWLEENTPKYDGLPVGEQILNFVSDIFSITGGDYEVRTAWLKKALLTKLNLEGDVKSFEFYSCLIEKRELLPLFVKEDVEFGNNISDYGSIVYQIYSFYERDPKYLLKEVEEKKMMPVELCRQKYENSWSCGIPEQISVLELCESLLGDLERGRFFSPNAGIEEKTGKFLEHRSNETRHAKNSMLVFSTEGLSCFDGANAQNIFFGTVSKHNQIRKDQEDELHRRMAETDNPMLIAAPTQYLQEPEVFLGDNVIPENVRFISMTDYYMFLWYKTFSQNQHDVSYVIIIEEYDKKIHAAEFKTTDSGYEVCAQADDISCRRTGKHLLSDLTDSDFFKFVRQEDAVFIVVTDHKGKVNNKLTKKEVNLLEKDALWEECFRDSSRFAQSMDEIEKMAVLYRYDGESHSFIRDDKIYHKI